MNKIFVLLLGIGVFYSAYASCGDVSESGTYNNNGAGMSTNPSPNSPPPTNPNTNPKPTPSSVPGDNDGVGNGGNTQGIGTDKGGGNGPAH